jgi:hypothetical protein
VKAGFANRVWQGDLMGHLFCEWDRDPFGIYEPTSILGLNIGGALQLKPTFNCRHSTCLLRRRRVRDVDAQTYNSQVRSEEAA